ncbi:MAG: hypothetical protein GY756_07705 [bacterium]|nr:hypothetical protein [bacterium]
MNSNCFFTVIKKTFHINRNFLFKSSFIRKSINIDINNEFFENIDSLLSDSYIVKNDGLTKAGILDFNEDKLFIKKYSDNRWSYKIRYLFRRSRPLRTLFASCVLEKNNVLTPKTFAVLINKYCGIINSAFVVSEPVENMASKDFFSKIIKNKKDTILFLDKIIDLLAEIHLSGIGHKDCKLSNFFFVPTDKLDYNIGIWDLDGAVYCAKLSVYLRIKDLGRLIAALIELYILNDYKIDNSSIIKELVNKYNKAAGFELDRHLVQKCVDKHLTRKGFI